MTYCVVDIMTSANAIFTMTHVVVFSCHIISIKIPSSLHSILRSTFPCLLPSSFFSVCVCMTVCVSVFVCMTVCMCMCMGVYVCACVCVCSLFPSIFHLFSFLLFSVIEQRINEVNVRLINTRTYSQTLTFNVYHCYCIMICQLTCAIDPPNYPILPHSILTTFLPL